MNNYIDIENKDKSITKTTIESMRKEGYKVGLIRPKTLWPYPNEAFKKIWL